jgi:hypothetical protein
MQLQQLFRKTPWLLLLIFFILAIAICSSAFIMRVKKRDQEDKRMNSSHADLKVGQIANSVRNVWPDAATMRTYH